MYNSYSNDNFYHKQFEDSDVIIDNNGNAILPSNTDTYNENSTNKNSVFSGIFDNFSTPEITTETLILFAVIFFAIYDDFDMDLLIILGILFLIGI